MTKNLTEVHCGYVYHNGEPYPVEILIDKTALLNRLGVSAIKNKTRCSKLAGGNILVRIGTDTKGSG